MTRRQERSLALLLLFVGAGLIVYMGFKGWRIYLLPAQYIGYLVAAIGVLGVCGVNIWHKGPLDPADDAKVERNTSNYSRVD